MKNLSIRNLSEALNNAEEMGSRVKVNALKMALWEKAFAKCEDSYSNVWNNRLQFLAKGSEESYEEE